MPLNRAPVEMGTLIAETLRAQAPLAADKGLRLESDVPPTLPPAWVDAELIGRVLQNLAGNAIKFTPVRRRDPFGGQERRERRSLCAPGVGER